MTLAKLIARLTKGYIKETGKVPTGLDKLRIKMEAAEKLRQMNKVIQFPQQRSFKQEIESMINDGTIKMGQVDKMNDNVRTRQMFQNSNLNKPRAVKTEDQIREEIKANNKKFIQSLKDNLDDPEDFALGGRAGLRFGGDTMGGKNDRSKSSPGPDRSRVSDRQQANHERAMRDRSNQGNRNYSPIKQIAKQTAISTAKNLGTKKLMNVLGLSKFTNPLGIAMVLRGAYNQAKNPVLTEEDLTLGLMTDTQKDLIDKQVKMGKAIDSFDPDATFKAAKIFDDKGSEGIFGIGKREAEPMTREEYNDYISQKGFAAGGIAGMLGERPRYQTGGDVAYDASDASIFGSSAISVTPETIMDGFGNQVQKEMGNTYNPPLIEDVIEEKNNIEQEGTLIPEQGGGRPIGGSSGITTLSDGTVYNPGRPVVPPEQGGGKDLIKDPFKDRGPFNRSAPVSDPTIRNQADIADPVTGKTVPKDLMSGFQSFLQESGAMNRPMTADVVSYRLPDGTVQQGSSTMRGLMNQYLKSIGQSPTTGVPASDRKINTNASPLAQAALADGGIARAGFVGGGMGRRGFLKMLAGLGAGIGAAKTGILKFAGKEPVKQVTKEVVKQSASTPPPYFFKLAEKIKMLGDEATATTERVIAKRLDSKDGKSTYLLEEDITSGDTIIKKINKEGDEMITDVEIMELKKGEVVKGRDGRPVRTPDEYEEVTESNARIEGDVFNDPYYTDGIEIDEIMKEIGEQAPSIKKASGGIARMLGE